MSITIITTKRNPKRGTTRRKAKRIPTIYASSEEKKLWTYNKKMKRRYISKGKNKKIRRQLDEKYGVNPKRKRRIVRARKNPVRIKLEKIIVAFVNTGPGRKMKRYYFNGTSFSRDKHDAERYPGDAAKSVARKMLGRLPPKIHGLSIEKP